MVMPFRRASGPAAEGGVGKGCAKHDDEATISSPGAASKRIAELERKIGQQQVELDFFGKPCGRSREHAIRATELA